MKQLASISSELTRMCALQLAAEIAHNRVSSEEVVEAHIARIETVNSQLNAVVMKLYDEARRAARTADETRRSGQSLGPLHGVPMTVKECFHVAGTPSTIGVSRFQNEIFPADGATVRRLRAAGAIILGKTNVPQLMLLHETDNPVYGRTNNPWNLERSPGGSSGGEAAIVAAGGSPLGLANDIGGSIRQPAHCCGIYGIKPTTGRFTNTGARQTLVGMQAITPQPGFLARSVDDLYLGLSVLSVNNGSLENDETPAALPHPAQVDVGRLRIGLVEDDGFFSPSPAIRRAVREAGDAMRAVGAEVEPFSLPDVPLAVRLYLQLISADGGAGFRELLGRCQRDWRISRLMRMGMLPRGARAALVAGMMATGQRKLADLIRWTGRISSTQYWKVSHERQEYLARFREALTLRRIDALILPPHALPAIKHGGAMHLPLAASYCLVINLLGFPAGAAPITQVQEGEQSDRAARRQIVDRASSATEAGSVGLPVGVQVVAGPWREDIVLAIMGVLERAFPVKLPS